MSPDDTASVPGSRVLLNLQTGALIAHGGRTYRVESVLDFTTAICIDLADGRRAALPISALSARPEEPTSSQDLATIDDPTWARAQARHAAIAPLLGGHTRRSVHARAQEVGVSTTTLYRWLADYRGQRTTAALIPKARGWKPGHSRLDVRVDLLIDEIVRMHYLTPQRLPISRIAQQVALECHRRNLPVPHYNAVARRIHALPEQERLRTRGSRELADRRFRPVPGKFPEADFPLAVVQIDHTPLDVIIVDDEHRQSIGRPWLTLAVDVYSRMVTGYYLSLDEPCEASVGLCVARSISPKEELLQALDIEAAWPVWGVMHKIHVDNGADFRSGSFRKSCELYGINLEFRPVKAPHFGGHVERILGTLAREVHTLPGTTFSSVAQRGEYRSDKHATMTLDELEHWLVRYICCVYHAKTHSALGTAPIKQWERGIFAENGCGLPARPTDTRRVQLDFMPAFERKAHPNGVRIDGLTYYSEALRGWVGAADPRDREHKRTFVFRRDPRDISRIWFFDPDSKDYYELPYANRALPRMSLWEYRSAREAARKEGMGTTNEHQVALAMESLRQHVEDTAHKTKSARRTRQRRRHHERIAPNKDVALPKSDTTLEGGTPIARNGDVTKAHSISAASTPPTVSSQASAFEDALLETVEPFEEVW